MTNLNALEDAFGSIAKPESGSFEPSSSVVTDRYERRLQSLLKAESGRYANCLDRSHDYVSDSEADLGVVDAMVVRHFTDGEIWQTLEGSRLFAARVAKKGEKHARKLFANEIEKARGKVTLFAEDPGAEPFRFRPSVPTV
jgi:hypothetical protein